MIVHLFGATSSPSIYNFSLRRTTVIHGDQYDKQISEPIERNMYVDDCLVLAKTNYKAVSLVEIVTSICKQGGLNIIKWASTSPNVVNSIPEKDCAKEVKQWNLHTDSVRRTKKLFLLLIVTRKGYKLFFKVMR
ncbi:Hypothetical predicted protein [Mytilus galloprovincialis]|uniref:Reverse transcriptase domain-containing protein n=1 Tax=Mytilus galloprovincialis TaxID=29158 RepID=A0A8B6BNL6_MYTGA|nr:Hypothetical predicted protein [Mytilus galloprovincialis]VDH98084.1 Hypothetical predicted protein [Mytilus galloprovincialis]